MKHRKDLGVAARAIGRVVVVYLAVCLGGCQLDRRPAPSASVAPDGGGTSAVGVTGDGDGEPDPCAECGPDCESDPRCVPEKLPNGGACRTGSQCQSGNCRGGLCCDAGRRCCADTSECVDLNLAGEGTFCEQISACQGKRGTPLCEDHGCIVSEGTDDDRGCAGMEARDCGPYPSVFCTDEIDQTVAACTTQCADDGDCDNASFCHAERCEYKRDNGSECSDNAHCASGNCGGAGERSVCCPHGDTCCASARDCPDAFGQPPVCMNTMTCQGVRRDPVCDENFTCRAGEAVDDDSACSDKAQDCGTYAPVSCTGRAQQNRPTCPTSCEDDDDCATGAFCDDADKTCKGARDNGQTCSRQRECESGRCNNQHCCDRGTCCADAADCDATGECTNLVACQGERRDPVCVDFQCGLTSGSVPDDSYCQGQLAKDCGNYTDIICTAQVEQTPQPCDVSCQANDQCDNDTTCIDDTCQ